jgi:hypothetical protein
MEDHRRFGLLRLADKGAFLENGVSGNFPARKASDHASIADESMIMARFRRPRPCERNVKRSAAPKPCCDCLIVELAVST